MRLGSFKRVRAPGAVLGQLAAVAVACSIDSSVFCPVGGAAVISE